VDHPVAVRANDGQVLQRRLVPRLEPRYGFRVVALSEPFPELFVDLGEVEAAGLAGQSPRFREHCFFLFADRSGPCGYRCSGF
jgi:hypothetical protein